MSKIRTIDAAEQLGVSDDTIRRWAHLGLIESERRGPRLLFVDPETLQATAVAQ